MPELIENNRFLLRLKRRLARIRAGCAIKKLDPKPIPKARHEIRLFMKVRNESLRLPFLLEYYFNQGVDRVFVLDHGSTDNTRTLVLSKLNAHLFQVSGPLTRHGIWFDVLLHRYGLGHWCVIADADEQLIYPHYETMKLRRLCDFLDENSFNALHCLLLDMYPGGPLEKADYQAGSDPLTAAPYFDAGAYTTELKKNYVPAWEMYHSGPELLYGGMRQRVFGIKPCLSKFPLFRFTRGMHLSPGMHFIENAHVANIRGALLHFKYLQDFPLRVKESVEREEHWQKAKEYKAYLKTLGDSAPSFYSPASAKYSGSGQLVDLGLMKGSPRFDSLSG